MSVHKLTPENVSYSLFMQVILWQNVALQAMDLISKMTRGEEPQFSVARDPEMLVNGPAFQERLARVVMIEHEDVTVVRLKAV